MTLHQSTLNAVRETARPQTLAASAGVARDPAHRSVAPPLYNSAPYRWESAVDKPAYDYARSGNPTRAALESAIAELEGAERAVVTSSGMSAIDVALSLLRPGDTVLAPSDCYGGTHRLLKARAARGQFKVEFVDLSDKRVAATAIRERPNLVLI